MIWNMSSDDFDSVASVHLKVHWNMSHHAIKYMQVGFGRIVNFSSNPSRQRGAKQYGAAKAGIIDLLTIAKETSKFGITANAICPSADTRMTINEKVGKTSVNLKQA